MPIAEAITRVIVALLSGMLIGVEREKARAGSRQQAEEEEELTGKEFPGLRTFTLIALYASMLGYMFSIGVIDAVSFSMLVAVFLVVVAVFSVYRLLVTRVPGVTTSVVMMLDFAIGLLAGFGQVVLAASLAVLSTFILAIKLPVSRVIGRISYEELLWALELGIVLVVLGPVLLTVNLTFYGVSVSGLYLFFALVLVASYMGYVVVRIKGVKGLAYLSFLGGFAHSEATLTGLLELLPASERRRIGHHAAVLSNTAMLLRDLAIAWLAGLFYVRGSLSPTTGLLILGVVAASSLAVAAWHRMMGVSARVPPTAVSNPLNFGTAAKTSLVYIAIAMASHALASSYGGSALSLAAFIGGLVSSSATILALISSVGQSATVAVPYAMAAGVLNKIVYAYTATGDWEVVARVALVAGVQALLLLAPMLLLHL